MKKQIYYLPARLKHKDVTFIPAKKNGKIVFPHKKAVPNKALTPKDIVDRFMKGLPQPEAEGATKPVYPDQETLSHDSPDLSKMSRMDVQDRKDFARGARVKMKPQEADPKPDPKKDPPKDE